MTRFIVISIIAMASFSSMRAADTTVPATAVEARGVWLHLRDFGADAIQGKKAVREMVARYADANFNLIMPWVVSEYVAGLTDTNYHAIEPTAAWDALDELVRVAHERGMQVHPWYSFTYYKSPRSPEFNPKHGGNPDWAACSLGDFNKGSNAMTDMCPLHPEARQWQVKLIEGLLDRYPLIGGIHIEEPGFGYPQNCVCKLCRSTFKSIHGRELTDMIDSPEAEDFRCIGTTEVIRQLRERLQKRKPQPVFSVNGGPLWRVDRTLGRDWKRWAELGWIDYYGSQNYNSDLATFASYTQTNLDDLKAHCQVFAGIGVKWSGGATSLPVTLQQVEAARQRGAKGILFFSAYNITDEHLTALKNGPFKTPAAFPAFHP